MNTLFLIGNGFDLNLGLKTRYSDFYREYAKEKSNDKDINKLKNSITTSIENWSDMEIALGNFTSQVKTKDDFLKVHDHIGDNLAEYLKAEEDILDFKLLDKSKFLQSISNPEDFLNANEKAQIIMFKETWRSTSTWRISIMTFNYTETIEKMIGANTYPIKISKNGNSQIILQKIVHVHGYMDKRMVMGVNDQLQVANQKFMETIDFAEAFIKPFCNETMGHRDDKWCQNKVSTANLICIFGSSIGDTDKIWWEQIGKRLLYDQTCLIIFTRGEEIPLRREYKKSVQKRKIIEQFLSKTKLSKEDRNKVKSKIFVGVNTNLFNLLSVDSETQ